MSKIPQKLSGFRAYLKDDVLLGVVNATLPDPELMTETISGAGIAGEIDDPVPGHYKSMSLSMSFRSVTAAHKRLGASGGQHVELRGSIQVQDAEGKLGHQPLRVVARGPVKKAGLGKLETGKPMDAEYVMEVVYLLVELDGEKLREIDKYNYIDFADGADQLEQVRENLGF